MWITTGTKISRVCYIINMPLEHKPEQFNKENFTSAFTNILDKYFEASKAIDSLYDRGVTVNVYEEDKKRFEHDKKQASEKMTSLIVNSLKLSGDKQEILNIVHEIIRGLNIQNSPLEFEYDEVLSERDLLNDIILALLKSN
jgi:hypothetical protein